MFKFRNPFKKRKKEIVTGTAVSEKLTGIGEIAWKSINLENEPIINADLQSVITPKVEAI